MSTELTQSPHLTVSRQNEASRFTEREVPSMGPEDPTPCASPQLVQHQLRKLKSCTVGVQKTKKGGREKEPAGFAVLYNRAPCLLSTRG